ncbi:hypothetical protein BS78_08G138200 [Paspalum vaginatum]|nr:hypothetical protein BS78_08G138200 [Paspalum vaginatum]
MAPAKLAAVLILAAAVGAIAARPPSTAAAPESCQTQIKYFTNCLARDEIRGQCCSAVETAQCLCQLKREVALPCRLHRHHQRKCSVEGPAPPSVKLAELQRLPCFKALKC